MITTKYHIPPNTTLIQKFKTFFAYKKQLTLKIPPFKFYTTKTLQKKLNNKNFTTNIFDALTPYVNKQILTITS